MIIPIISVFAYFQYFKTDTASTNEELIQQLIQSPTNVSPETLDYLDKLTNHTQPGGPNPDQIPSIDMPIYETSQSADEWLKSEDIIFGINKDNHLVAYPQRILVHHQVANITINNQPHTVSYCPLTGTVIGFRSQIAGTTNTTFGVSGKLVNSNLILYDRATNSHWPQIATQSNHGPAKGNKLTTFPIHWTTWEQWKTKYPETLVLSTDTGFDTNYDQSADPYGNYPKKTGYYTEPGTLFPVQHSDPILPEKAVVIAIPGEYPQAILKSTLKEQNQITTKSPNPITLKYDPELGSHQAYTADGNPITTFETMWFAWKAYYPQTTLTQ